MNEAPKTHSKLKSAGEFALATALSFVATVGLYLFLSVVANSSQMPWGHPDANFFQISFPGIFSLLGILAALGTNVLRAIGLAIVRRYALAAGVLTGLAAGLLALPGAAAYYEIVTMSGTMSHIF